MNRRSFLKLLSSATIGAGVVYSFPSIIVPKNIQKDTMFGLAGMNLKDGSPLYWTNHKLYMVEPATFVNFGFEGFELDPNNPDIAIGRISCKIETSPRIVEVIKNVSI